VRLPLRDPFNRLRQPPRPRLVAFCFGDPLDVLALVTGRKRVEGDLHFLTDAAEDRLCEFGRSGDVGVDARMSLAHW